MVTVIITPAAAVGDIYRATSRAIDTDGRLLFLVDFDEPELTLSAMNCVVMHAEVIHHAQVDWELTTGGDWLVAEFTPVYEEATG